MKLRFKFEDSISVHIAPSSKFRAFLKPKLPRYDEYFSLQIARPFRGNLIERVLVFHQHNTLMSLMLSVSLYSLLTSWY